MREQLFLPAIGKGPVLPPGMEDKESQFFKLMKNEKGQRRASMEWNYQLALAAQYRAADMGKRDYFSHVDPDGKGPNWWVNKFEYKLPSNYLTHDDANYIESIAAYGTVLEMWDILMKSDSHRTHLLGLDDTYAKQTSIGIGYAYFENSKYLHYYVIISCPPEV